MHIHFLGIGGTLMGSLALLARERGDRVSGCDQDLYPPMSDQLAAAGIDVRLGWDPSHLDDTPDLVVVGNANLPRGNPVLEAVLERGLRYTSGAEWLGRDVLADRWVLAVSGTHGKTTTTAMLTHILEYAGLAPGYLIGGVPLDFERSARLGQAPFFVVEADEYDTSYFDRRAKFVHYRPRTLIINNLEWDHADIYPDLAAIQAQFGLLLRSVPGNALVVAPHGSAAVEAVFERGLWTPVERFAAPGGSAPAGGWHARSVASDGSSFEVALGDAAFGTVHWGQFGTHNISNALAAVAAARHAGVPPARAVEALSSFRGVKRRMEVIGRSRDVTVYDDFAHHPTAIRATLAGLRARVGNDEIVAVIEPRSHTMSLGALKTDLVNCASAADRVIWRRTERLRWDISEFRGAAVATEIADDNSAIMTRLTALPPPRHHRHVVIMSNGAFGGIHGDIVAALCPTA